MQWGRALVVAACGLQSVACSPSDVPAASVASVQEWTLSSEPVTSVGVRAGDPDYELYRVQAAMRLSDGTLVIANGGSYELRFYDSTGVHIRSSGRRGEGPAEFQQIFSAQRTRGDTVAVWDNLQRRITYFGPDGQWARDFPLVLSGQSVELNSLVTPAQASDVAFLADGSFVVAPLIPLWALTGLRTSEEGYGVVRKDSVATDGVWRAAHPVYVFNPSGEFVAATSKLPSTEYVMLNGTAQIRMFGKVFRMASGGDVALVFTGVADQVNRVLPDGGTTPLLLPLPARAVTPDLVSSQIDRKVRLFAEASRDQVRALYESVPPPDSLPSLSRILIDERERIWAKEYLTTPEQEAASEVRWHIFSSTGDLIATVNVPAELRVSDVSFGYVTGYVRDEFDIERVDSYRLQSPGGTY